MKTRCVSSVESENSLRGGCLGAGCPRRLDIYDKKQPARMPPEQCGTHTTMNPSNEHQPTGIPFGARIGLASLTCFVLLWSAGLLAAEPLTLPADQRPEWLARDGIVMAGSWEPLLFRVRRDGSDGYTPSAAERAAYRREHSPQMVARLKALGVNFVMLHCYKGAGLEAERESMQDAVRFAKLCHQSGLRVGVYTFSGAFLWEPFFKEVPAAEAWVVRDRHGNRRAYGSAD